MSGASTFHHDRHARVADLRSTNLTVDAALVNPHGRCGPRDHLPLQGRHDLGDHFARHHALGPSNCSHFCRLDPRSATGE